MEPDRKALDAAQERWNIHCILSGKMVPVRIHNRNSCRGISNIYDVSRVPSNEYSSTPFFRKTLFVSKTLFWLPQTPHPEKKLRYVKNRLLCDDKHSNITICRPQTVFVTWLKM
jgi:hypothetical protein